MSVVSFVILSDVRLTNLSYVKGTFTLDNSYPHNGSTTFGYDVGQIVGGVVWFWGNIQGSIYEVKYDPTHNTIRVYDGSSGAEYTDTGSALDGLVVEFFAIRSTFAP